MNVDDTKNKSSNMYNYFLSMRKDFALGIIDDYEYINLFDSIKNGLSYDESLKCLDWGIFVTLSDKFVEICTTCGFFNNHYI